MKRLLLVIMVLFILLPLSNKAQVSGSNGNRFIMNAGITNNAIGYIFKADNYFGKRFELNYVIQRNKSVGFMIDLHNLDGYYESLRLPNYSEFPYDYERSGSLNFPIKSKLFELSVRFYNDEHIAPIGNYLKFTGGVVLTSHEFDVDKFKSNLVKSDLYTSNTGAIPNPSDVDIPVKEYYSSPYVGVGIGESFPILTDNLFLDLGVSFRVFFVKNYFVRTFEAIMDIDENLNGRDDENNKVTKENMVGYEVVGPATFFKTLNMNISLRYAF